MKSSFQKVLKKSLRAYSGLSSKMKWAVLAVALVVFYLVS